MMRVLASVLTVAMLVMTFMVTMAPYAGAAVIKPGQGAKFTQAEVDDYTSKALSADELQTAAGGQWYNPNTWDWWVWGLIAVVVVVIVGGLWAGDVF
ncbi:MAG: hypothetical protein KJ621_07770 [Proteobacteria bacterium]|nr:hypothetical protein [Pseudomonadota bacterium]MBU1742981.1 hypothetical protein [Pseudomonadota bacterium]